MSTTLMLVNNDGSIKSALGVVMSPHFLDIPKGTVLSFRTLDYKGRPDASGVFTMGAANVEMRDFHRGNNEWAYMVIIESSNKYDFYAALREVFIRLGKPFEDLAPSYMIPPSEQSFIRGVRNDFYNLVRFVSKQWTRFRKGLGLHFMR